MRKIISTLVFSFFSFFSFSQKLTFNDLVKFANQTTDESAELLISKGFHLERAYNDSYSDTKSFELNNNPDGNINVDFDLYKNGGERITSCFSQTYDKDYKALEAQIKEKAKKIRFFFSKEFNAYLTEYYVGQKFLYLTRGLCWNDETKFKYGAFIISTKKYE